MKRLYPRIMALTGGVFAVVWVAAVVFVHVSGSRKSEREWLARAKTLNQVAIEALYASLLHGGGKEGSRQVLERLKDTGAFTRVRVVRGDAVIRQFGMEPTELPQDDIDRRALAGEEVGEVHLEDGYRVVRYVTPLQMQAECQACHQTELGSSAGAISAEILLREFEVAL